MNSRKEDLLTKSQNLSPDQGLAKEDNNQRIQKNCWRRPPTSAVLTKLENLLYWTDIVSA